MTYIDADDLANAQNGWNDTTILRDGNNHSVAVTSVAINSVESISSIITTAEKNQASGIYTNTWVNADPQGPTTKMKHR